MSEHFENRKNEVALRRFAAVSFIEQKVREGFGVVEALRLAALRPWKILTSAASVSSPRPRLPVRLSNQCLIPKWTISNAKRYSTNSKSFVNASAATRRLLNPMRYNFRHVSVRSPRNSLTKYTLFPRNTLTLVPRNNVARYTMAFDSPCEWIPRIPGWPHILVGVLPMKPLIRVNPRTTPDGRGQKPIFKPLAP